MKREFSKREIIFSFIIFDLILCIVIVAIWRAETTSELLNQISLGSSIASILLALLAIGYAFIQSRDASQQNISTQIMLDKINEKLEQVKVVKDELNLYRGEVASFREDSKTHTTSLLESLKEFSNGELSQALRKSNATDAVVEKVEEYEGRLNRVIDILNRELLETMEVLTKKSLGGSASIFNNDGTLNSNFAAELTFNEPIENATLQTELTNYVNDTLETIYPGITLAALVVVDNEDTNNKIVLLILVYNQVVLSTTVKDVLNRVGVFGKVFTLKDLKRF